jgi:hypothetical protein
MPWLADTDVRAAYGVARGLVGAWDRVELATGDVRREAVPAEAEPPGAFAAGSMKD